MPGLLSHIRVVDLTRVFAGPWATQILADFGAEVIKVEHPGGGDEVRGLGVPWRDAAGKPTDITASFVAMNRGKRSITVDLKQAEGVDLVKRLAAKSDVFIENFKTGAMARMGLGYEDLKAINPRLVYCSITGFGQTGPNAGLPGYDPLFQALSGLMSITGPADGTPGAGPNLVGYSVSDITTGLYAAIGILGALNHRDTVSGQGQHIDLALLDSQIAALSHIAMNYLASGKVPIRAGAASQMNAPWQLYETADRPIMISVGNNSLFRRLAAAIGKSEMAEDARFRSNRDRMANKEELNAALNAAFAGAGQDRWIGTLVAAGVPTSRVNTIDRMLEEEQVKHRGTLVELDHPRLGRVRSFANPIRYSATPAEYHRAPPELGADTESVLTGLLGLGAEELKFLGEKKII